VYDFRLFVFPTVKAAPNLGCNHVSLFEVQVMKENLAIK
jgi:hypothetical protein